jgi:hypothetical protein
MSDETTIRAVDFECREEGRTAHLLLQWRREYGARQLVGVQCDNPKLQGLDDWHCGWSCWERIGSEHRDDGES